MPESNAALLQRADLALADLSSNGGLLDAEQTNAFLDIIQESPTILKQVRFIRMTAPQRKINKIGFNSRILRAASQTGGANDDGSNDRYVRKADRAKPTTSQIQLSTEEVIAEVRLPYEVLEDNIEGQSMDAHIMRLIGERVAIDLEELALAGDTSLSATDAFLGLQDGYLKRITSHVVDNVSAGPTPALFDAGMLALPQKYHRSLPQMKHFISVANRIKYRSNVAKRATGYGDSALTQDIALFAAGVPIEAAPMLAATSNGTKGILTIPNNLIFGVQREVRVETDKDIRSREYIVVVTARVATQIEEEDAAVKYINI